MNKNLSPSLPLAKFPSSSYHCLSELSQAGELLGKVVFDHLIVLLLLHQLVQVLDDLAELLVLAEGGSDQGEDGATAQPHHQLGQVVGYCEAGAVSCSARDSREEAGREYRVPLHCTHCTHCTHSQDCYSSRC